GSAATNNARGYAQVTAHMLGNSNAEGFLRYGQYEESIAAAAVVDWLNGRIRAYTTRTSTVEVKAYWASGDCAASGTSYEGTLPVAAAVTGVEGLRTIYPGAPVTNAYNYFRENAIAYGPGGYVGEDIMATSHYTQGRLWSSSAQAYPGNNSPAWDVWWDWQLYQRFEGDGGVGDYSSFWDERNPLSFADDMRKDVGVIMGAGLNDGNVKFRNTGLLNEALKHNGVEVIKGQWSQGQHEMANGMSGGWTNATNMHLWLDYYLWGIDNGIVDSVPNYRIASNISGVKDYDVWPAGVYQKFYPQGGRVGTIATTPQANITTHTFKDDFLASSLVTFPTFDYAAISTSSQVPTQARANGVGLANGFLPNALIQQGQAQSLAANSRSAWRNRIVGGLNNSTTAWGAPSNRFCLASSALAGTFSKTAEVIDRVIYRMDIPENFTISGPPSMTAEIAASKDVGALSCMLVEWWSGGVKVVALGSVDVRNPNPDGTLSFDVPGIANIEKGGNWHPNYLFQTQDILPYGTSTPTAANFNSYTWEMDVTEYTFRAGRELCVILFGSDPEFTFMTKAPTEFTVNIGPNTYLSLPIVNPITVSTISEEVVEEIDFETEEAEVIEMTEMLEVVETVAEVAETIIIIE
ncbi:MAG: hypothetical protein FWG43_03175, partial [Clostridiales bacterium]|nr:hypothetical protein [Clostridiales bacterium]